LLVARERQYSRQVVVALREIAEELDFKPLSNHDAQILFQTMIKPQYMGFRPKRSLSVSNFKA
jgi:hypothetical protein